VPRWFKLTVAIVSTVAWAVLVYVQPAGVNGYAKALGLTGSGLLGLLFLMLGGSEIALHRDDRRADDKPITLDLTRK